MRWKIKHTLTYRYPRPVAIDVQTIRLQPRLNSRQQLLHFELNILPEPSFLTHHNDIENNELFTAWFKGMYRELQITAQSEVELNDYNPFDFILTEPGAGQLPVVYPESIAPLVNAYIMSDKKTSTTLNDFIQPVLLQAKFETVPFLNALVNHIFSRFKKRNRTDGHPHPVEKTIEEGQGACRDLAWLYIAACRSLGLAARFVSGYYVPFNPRKKPELHAWAEVFLPGAGWIGFDPSSGLAVVERYIAVSASYDPAFTLPTGGTFWGKTLNKSVLKTAITIDPVE
jgi:transglutaminase-like putative cysteine protease